jgi:3-hydroxyisobutyrate dehydrogenase-like beta-hydroxyacid dehydrogenase
MANIAFLGTGLLGSGFIEGMLSRGDKVTAWNRTLAKAERLEASGAVVATSPAGAVSGADRVHLCLSDDAAVDGVLDAILPALGPNTPIVDHTTVLPGGAQGRYARLNERRVAFLHAPVFMSPQMAKEAKGILMCSAPADRFESLKPVFEKMTGTVMYLGDSPAKAAAFKLFGNAMIITVIGGLADVFALADASGIDLKDALSLFKTFSPAGNLDYRGSKMAEGVFSPAMFEMTMARKDVRLMLETAAGSHAPLVVLPAIAQRMDALIAAGHGSDDLGALAVDAVKQPARS